MSFGFGGNQFSSISNFNEIETIRGPPGPRGVSLENVTSSQATGSDNVQLNFILTNGETKSVSFSAEVDNIITGGTFDNMIIKNLTTVDSANFSNNPVTVTNINGVNFSNLASDFTTLQYTVSSTIDQAVKTTSDVIFNDVTCENVYASIVTCDVINASVFNAITTNEFLINDKYILGCASPTGPTGSWNLDGSNDNAIMGFASGYNTAVGFQYANASNKFSLLNAEQLDIGYLKLKKSDPTSSVDYLTIVGKDDPIISGKIFIGSGSGKCLYFSSCTGASVTDLICIDDSGIFTTKNKIGIKSATTEWNPTRWLQIEDSTEPNIALVSGGGTHDGELLLNNSAAALDLRTSTSTPIRFRPYTNSNSNYVHIDTSARMGLNCVPDSAYILDAFGNQRINSTSGDSSLTIMNTVSASNNYTSIIQKSGTTNKYLQFKNYSNSPNSGDLQYAFTNYSDVLAFQIRNSYSGFVAQKLAISDSSVGNFTPTGNLHVKASTTSFYLESTSGNSGVIIQGPSSSGSSAQFYLDTSNNYFVSNFHLNKPIVFQINNGGIVNAMRVEGNANGSILIGMNSVPSAPGSYSYSTGQLCVSGDIWMGTASNTYRSLLFGGGNSVCSLFGNFSVQGDGANLSYNYLVDSSGTARIPNTSGQTSLLQCGFGSWKIKTGAVNTAPSTKVYLYQNRFSIGKDDNVADSSLEVKSSNNDDILMLTSTAGNNRFKFTDSGTMQIKNATGAVNFQVASNGESGEYGDTSISGYFRVFEHATVTSGSAIVQIPADTGQSMWLNGVNLHVGSNSNTDSGIEFQVTGDSKMTKGLIINSSSGDNDTQIKGDTDANLFYVDASTDRIGIGTSTPTEKLQVNGNVKIGGNITVTGSSSLPTPGEFSAPDASLLYTAILISGVGDTYPLYFVTIYGNASFSASQTQTINFPSSFQAASDLTSKIVCTYAPVETNNLSAIKFKDRTATSVKIECIDPLDGTQISYTISFFAKKTSWAYS